MLNFEVKHCSVASVKQGLNNVDMPSQLHDRIRSARKFAKLTQEELGERLEVSKAAVAQWEAKDEEKRTLPTIANLIRIRRETGVSMDWLMDDSANADEIIFANHPELSDQAVWPGLPEGPALDAALNDLHRRASQRSQEALKELIELANKNALTDKDWEAIEWIARRVSKSPQR